MRMEAAAAALLAAAAALQAAAGVQRTAKAARLEGKGLTARVRACVRAAAAASRGRRRSAWTRQPHDMWTPCIWYQWGRPMARWQGSMAGSTHGQWPACQCVACSERRPFPDHHTHAWTHLSVRLPCCSWAGKRAPSIALWLGAHVCRRRVSEWVGGWAAAS